MGIKDPLRTSPGAGHFLFFPWAEGAYNPVPVSVPQRFHDIECTYGFHAKQTRTEGTGCFVIQLFTTFDQQQGGVPSNCRAEIPKSLFGAMSSKELVP
jgi:hypothetical protein